MESTFASYIKSYLHSKYGKDADQLFQLSHILQYLEHKTKSANKGLRQEVVSLTFMLYMSS